MQRETSSFARHSKYEKSGCPALAKQHLYEYPAVRGNLPRLPSGQFLSLCFHFHRHSNYDNKRNESQTNACHTDKQAEFLAKDFRHFRRHARFRFARLNRVYRSAKSNFPDKTLLPLCPGRKYFDSATFEPENYPYPESIQTADFCSTASGNHSARETKKQVRPRVSSTKL